MNKNIKRNTSEKQTFAAIYARTSSPNQKFNYSIKEQINSCRKYCNERGWAVQYVFVDEGESGGSVERPKFQLMLEKAKARKFDVIIFWKLDRFCRSLVDLINVERILRKCGVGLCSVTEYIDTTTSIGRFNFRSIASVAELEREIIGERARLGLYALAKECKWPNPHPPLGYDKNSDGKLVINENEANLVRRIFKMYLLEKSIPQVAFILNEEGIRTKRGKKWNARAVRDILTDEMYIGKYNVAGINCYVKEYRIIDDDLFKKTSEIRLRYKVGGAKRPPMANDRKMTSIDRVFNEYLGLLNSSEEGQEQNFHYKAVKSESELFRLLREGWSLVKIINDKFAIRKRMESTKRGSFPAW
jgi:site-specific DNA recombinase